MSAGSMRSPEDSLTPAPRFAEFGVGDVWNLLLRHWHVVLLFTSLGILMSSLYWYYIPRTYESSAQVLLMRKNSQLVSSTGQGPADSETKIGEDLLSTHVQLVQSNRLVGEALAADGLEDLPSIQENLGPYKKYKTPVEYVVSKLAVTRGGTGQAKSAHVLNIKFKHVSDVDAQRVLAALVDRYQGFLREKFQDVNKEAAELISKARQELEGELVAAEERYLESRRDAPLLWDGDKSTNIPRRRYEGIQDELSNLELKQSQVATRLEEVEATLEDLKASNATGLDWLAVIDEKDAARLGAYALVFQGESATASFQSQQPSRMTTAQTEGQHLLKLLVQEKTMKNEFGPQHPEMIQTKQQIRVVKDFLAQLDEKNRVNGGDIRSMLDPEKIVDSYVKLLKHDQRTLDCLIKELETKAAKEEKLAKKLVDYELEDETIRKEVKRKQELFDAVVNRLRDINLARDYGGFINEVVSPPEIGETVWPKIKTCLVLGALCGMILGCGVAAIGEFRDRSFRNPDEVSSTLGLPILSHVPDLLVNSKKRKPSSPLALTLCTAHRPKSRDAEVFRSLRTTLFSRLSAEKIKVIGISSSVQGDGKSTTLANLAVSIAQAGRRVLLIDCDLRRPSQHEKFAIENKAGVINVLQEEAELMDVIHDTLVPGLSFMSAGPPTANPAEILDSPKFAQLIELVRDRYDIVLCDCPPVLAVSDPCIVAPLLDAMLLVIRVSRDSRPQALQARAMLADVGAKVLGIIINGCDAPAHYFAHYGSNAGYGGYGGYGSYGYHSGTNGHSGSYYHDEDSTGERSHRQPEPAGVNGARHSHEPDAGEVS